MGCCALGTCQNPNCYLCVVMPRLFPPIEQCSKTVRVTTPGGKEKRVRCRSVKGHPRACQPEKKTSEEKPDTRDGAPPPKASRDPVFTPRRRVGPHR